MKILMQLAIILFICLLGEVIAAVLPFPFPASVISMLLVLALLLWGPLKIYHIQKQADFLLDNMGFFFVPPAVAIIGYLSYMEGKLAIILFICFISVFTTFAVTAWTVSAMMKFTAKRKELKRRANSAESE
ncbi:MAG: CidA/LrgA family protein [Peptococcaceae bacterium]|nr:CidA/LrgA family protein [Peptococcaceae bacterium]